MFDYIKVISNASKHLFGDILQIDNDKSKDRAVSDIKDYYDVDDFKKDDVYDITKDTTIEKELYDYAKLDKHYEKDKGENFDIGMYQNVEVLLKIM